MLTLEEAGFAKEAATVSESAMVASSAYEDSFASKYTLDHPHNRGTNSDNNRKSGRKFDGGGNLGLGRGHGDSSGSRGGSQQQEQRSVPLWSQQQWGYSNPWGWIPN